MTSQTCTTCQQEKPIEEFWKQPSKSGGYQAECKPCMRKRNNTWHATHRAQARVRNRAAWNNLRVNEPEYALWKNAKDRALRVGMEFSITVEDIVIPKFCPVLGIKLESGLGRALGTGLLRRDQAPSIDRINNAIGYVRGNILVVSFRANRIKSDAEVHELEAIARFYRSLA